MGESLCEQADRAKARWLQRIMYSAEVASSEKIVGFAIFDHLNGITLDCWPGQPRLAQLIGQKSTKTIQRAIRGLASRHLISVVPNHLMPGFRYRPVFRQEDFDKVVPSAGQSGSGAMDIDVHQSSQFIHQPPTVAGAGGTKERIIRPTGTYDRFKRGSYEKELAILLGTHGMNILYRLSQIDDAIIDRMCAALINGGIGKREIATARAAVRTR